MAADIPSSRRLKHLAVNIWLFARHGDTANTGTTVKKNAAIERLSWRVKYRRGSNWLSYLCSGYCQVYSFYFVLPRFKRFIVRYIPLLLWWALFLVWLPVRYFLEAEVYRLKILSYVKSVMTADYPTPAIRPAYSVLDCSKIDSCFDVTSPSWRDGIKIVIDRLQG